MLRCTGMPKKSSGAQGDKLSYTLPKGARDLFDQLVDLGIHGDSYSEVTRFLVETQLRVILNEGHISLRRNGKVG